MLHLRLGAYEDEETKMLCSIPCFNDYDFCNHASMKVVKCMDLVKDRKPKMK